MKMMLIMFSLLFLFVACDTNDNYKCYYEVYQNGIKIDSTTSLKENKDYCGSHEAGCGLGNCTMWHKLIKVEYVGNNPKINEAR
jgi:hypothetical protein